MVALEISMQRGRPAISQEMQALIRRLSRENVLWSAETIHGHLVLLGFGPPCPDTIRKYMVKPSRGTDKSQTWLTFLRNHLQVSWAMDFFTVPTLRFQILYIFVILNYSRRQVVHFAVTAHPTMAWVIQQLREAMPFGQQPTYLFRDNDAISTRAFVAHAGSYCYFFGGLPSIARTTSRIRAMVPRTSRAKSLEAPARCANC